jgi:hypothetical protein
MLPRFCPLPNILFGRRALELIRVFAGSDFLDVGLKNGVFRHSSFSKALDAGLDLLNFLRI